MQEELSVSCNVTFRLYSSTGKLKKKLQTHNLVVTTGKNYIADQLSAAPNLTKMSHIAVGTGSTAPAVGNTALQTELARKAFTSSVDSANVLTMTATFNTGEAIGALAEAGIFNSSSGGTLLARTLISPVINKTTNDILSVTWTLTVN